MWLEMLLLAFRECSLQLLVLHAIINVCYVTSSRHSPHACLSLSSQNLRSLCCWTHLVAKGTVRGNVLVYRDSCGCLLELFSRFPWPDWADTTVPRRGHL